MSSTQTAGASVLGSESRRLAKEALRLNQKLGDPTRL
jgi:hypothetical protein